MRKVVTIALFLFIGLGLFSQNDSISFKQEKQTDSKYIAWIYPSWATHVYGVMFNFWSLSDTNKSKRLSKTYGAEINLNPIGVFSPFVTVVHCIDPKTHTPLTNSADSLDLGSFREINGLQIGLLNLDPTIINGVDINLTGSFGSVTNGVTISGVLNKHYIINGVTVAIIGNHDSKCNGVQIGLINSCNELKGIQLGLWNKNQKRSLPIINWCFKKKRTSSNN
jgi:hypothetical protein